MEKHGNKPDLAFTGMVRSFCGPMLVIRRGIALVRDRAQVGVRTMGLVTEDADVEQGTHEEHGVHDVDPRKLPDIEVVKAERVRRLHEDEEDDVKGKSKRQPEGAEAKRLIRVRDHFPAGLRK